LGINVLAKENCIPWATPKLPQVVDFIIGIPAVDPAAAEVPAAGFDNSPL
jgi:hypothetical protein